MAGTACCTGTAIIYGEGARKFSNLIIAAHYERLDHDSDRWIEMGVSQGLRKFVLDPLGEFPSSDLAVEKKFQRLNETRFTLTVSFPCKAPRLTSAGRRPVEPSRSFGSPELRFPVSCGGALFWTASGLRKLSRTASIRFCASAAAPSCHASNSDSASPLLTRCARRRCALVNGPAAVCGAGSSGVPLTFAPVMFFAPFNAIG